MELKKFIPILLVLTFVAVGFVAAADTFEVIKGCTMVQSITIGDVNCSGTIDIASQPKLGVCCLFNTILRATNLLFTALIIIATLMIAYGGFTVVTSQGSDEGFLKGKNIITYAIYGIVIAILAKVIPSIALALL
ncbi:MAG: hypothetical protein Q8O39_01895 [bacterium]|nr:hypothetical protein [bacterium]